MLLEFTDRGIYCPQAAIFIDPWKPVDKALITHGHADHSRWGHKHYLCTAAAAPVIKYRLGKVNLQTTGFGEIHTINGVKISFHPAGHIVGSAQIRLEYKGEVWVVSGDYKLEEDGLTETFESIKCHTFITESTFGLPIYEWRPQIEVFQEINNWWRQNQALRKTTILTGYALGKAQRIIQNLDDSIGKIYTHGAIENVNEILRQQNILLKDTIRVTAEIPKEEYIGNIVIATPSAVGSSWIKKFSPYSIGSASGWMNLRGARRRRSVDRGFVLSDHADWKGLNTAIDLCEAEQVYVTHGYTSIFSKWLNERGVSAGIVETQFEGELAEIGESTEKEEEV
ncbi:ligase-associated DNA damage response exonuclease [Fulvivirga sp. M361]|uniref:ligase-associated DNA damage response exonuclease n=1 Tax=Fulvivirga sp. M361 TaxID=2594266 RepID=UPI00117B7C01|nr:ligase-associated DNA damage response exonuclease [Fulvivirga sp. M361]TRX62174.1 ligase-associated DNA damage response exonuclease [Fulvivirga sp. M361]